MQRFISKKFLSSALCLAAGSVFGLAATPTFNLAHAADSDVVASMHDALKERWYTTEVVVFRTTNAPADESILLHGERLSAAEERLRAGLASLKELEESEPSEGFDEEPENPSAVAINQLTLDPRDSGEERPALDAEPWERIKDYGEGDNLNTLVARNMATWETELRKRDGEWLSSDELQLGDAASKLNRSRSTEVLFHSGWVQSVPPRGNGKPIEIEAGEVYVDQLSGADQFRLSGNITVTLGRYLHVRPTLFYTPVTPPTSPALTTNDNLTENEIVAQARAAAAAARGETPSRVEVRDLSSSAGSGADSSANSSNRSALDRLRDRERADSRAAANPRFSSRFDQGEQERPPYMRIDQSRRVRSGELHYLDHPELGVLVRITPVEADAALQEQFALLQ